MTTSNIEHTVNSSLWAAYGDAIGFISELAEQKTMLKKRTGKETITCLTNWTRQIGGKFGPLISLPSGAYSDDTQLRLSTSRAINQNNYFDINAFSKIELPVWSSYALGAGIGSKLAAESLGKKSVAWYNNFYNSKKTNYVNSGGNGAAMRIQPHIWACRTPEQVDTFILDVIKNSLTTHGHPRAISGAVFHSLCLGHVFSNLEMPSITDARNFLTWITEIPNKIRSDINLNTAWIPLFESQTDIGLDQAYEEVYQELNSYLDIIEKWKNSENFTYDRLVHILDLKNKEIRGSGTLTAAAALAASYLRPDSLPSLMLDIANKLGTDTDSIATMVGALRGAIENNRPPQDLQDQSYLIYDAERLYAISKGENCNDFNYPDSITWNIPTSPLDFICIQGNKISFPPFGYVRPISNEFRSNSTDTYQYFYQWMVTEFNQSFLVKRRNSSTMKVLTKEKVDTESKIISKFQQHQLDIPEDYKTPNNKITDKSPDIDLLTAEAIKNNFDEKTIGNHIVMISKTLGINGAIAYSAIIAKAIIARNKHK